MKSIGIVLVTNAPCDQILPDIGSTALNNIKIVEITKYEKYFNYSSDEATKWLARVGASAFVFSKAIVDSWV